MPFNTIFSWYIGKRVPRIEHYRNQPVAAQQKVLAQLLSKAKSTRYFQKYVSKHINDYNSFVSAIPLSDYGTLKPFIDRSIQGEENLLWPGKTSWFAKSSGTTADRIKILPITEDLLFENHYAGGKDLLAQYYANFPKRKLYNAKHLIIGGSGESTENENGAFIGDLSAIIIHHLPFWTEARRTPKKEIALLSDWEDKLDKMARSVLHENICIIAGVPSWTSLLLKKVLEFSGKKTIAEVWPNLELYIHGGVNFAPYTATFEKLIGKPINYVESYNASEGYFGFQDQVDSKELLLMTDSQIFFEFIPMESFDGIHSKVVLPLEKTEVGVEYAVVISTNAGLWRYIIGDTIRFSSVYPFRFHVTGRTSHFINAFGEKMIVEHVEKAISRVMTEIPCSISDFTVAPYFSVDKQTGGHEWLIEFDSEPTDLRAFEIRLDELLKEENADYDAKRVKDLNIAFPRFHYLQKGQFQSWLKSKGKLGGQHKVPRLCNDRKILEQILLENA